MAHMQKVGGMAALVNVVAIATLLATLIVWIGPAAMADPDQLAELAVYNPAPLLLLDGLKFLSAAISIALILAMHSYLSPHRASLLALAASFGVLSVVCLLGNASLSVYAIAQAGTQSPQRLEQLNQIIQLLGLATIVLDGGWLLLVSWVALKTQQLPPWLCYLGLAMGALSLIPPLGLGVLLLSAVWSGWLGRIWLRGPIDGAA